MAAYEKLVKKSEEMVDQISIQVDARLRYQSVLLLAKSNKIHLKVEILEAKVEYNSASTRLRMLLNIDQNVISVSVDKVLVSLEFEALKSGVNVEGRPEFKINSYEIKALKMKKKSNTTELLFPRFRIGANGSQYGIPVDALF